MRPSEMQQSSQVTSSCVKGADTVYLPEHLTASQPADDFFSHSDETSASENPNDASFTIVNDKEKQQILTLRRLEP